MGYYKTCPYCGAHLDPGEKCDCHKFPEGPTVYNFLIDYEEEGRDMHTAAQIAPEPIMGSVATVETSTEYIIMQYALQRKLITAVIYVPGKYALSELVDIQERRRTLPTGSRFIYADVDALKRGGR